MRKKPNETNWNRMVEANKRMEEVVKLRKKNPGMSLQRELGIDRSGGDGMNKSERVKLEIEETDRIIRMCGVDGEGDIIVIQEDSDGMEREGKEERKKDIGNRVGSAMEGRYNREFSECELERAIRVVKSKTAPGEDGIEFGIIKKLTKRWKKSLLELFNEVWRNGRVPTRWKETRVRLIPKPQKRALRPISLLNCLGKIREKMVNERLRDWAEREGKLDRNQNGNGGKGKEVVAAFIDVKVAYDMVNHRMLGEYLEEMGCPRKLRGYLGDWIRDREVRFMRCDGGSKAMKLRRGLPQGSVLNPLLYNLYTAGIIVGIRELGVKILQYADDIVVYVEYGIREDGVERLEKAIKILCGIILDSKLNFREHTKCLGGVRKGACPLTLLRVFKALVRSVIEYGAHLYQEEGRNRDKIQKVHNAGIRIAMGYRMSTPINVMEVEAGIMKMEMRVDMLAEKYVLRKYFRDDREVCAAVEGMINFGMGENSLSRKGILRNAWNNTVLMREGMERMFISKERCSWDCDWMEKWCEVEKGETMKADGVPENIGLGEIKNRWFEDEGEVIEVYTDGSKMGDMEPGGAAVVIRRGREEWEEFGFTTRGSCSIFTIEAFAICMALRVIDEYEKESKMVIFSDSLSVIMKVKNVTNGEDEGEVIGEIRERLWNRNEKGNEGEIGKVCLAWIPAHIGIKGNERADRIAKACTGKCMRTKGSAGLPITRDKAVEGEEGERGGEERTRRAREKRKWKKRMSVEKEETEDFEKKS
ncbi:uncharacterized protein LOC143264504 [Megachile rotundata]|uniref:uncharacterized protein LOC143264504 n=1 Tax=Megachile rotundata TaxID=143995 RepID=UPI003FD6BE7E